jgi:hypothetical protein
MSKRRNRELLEVVALGALVGVVTAIFGLPLWMTALIEIPPVVALSEIQARRK